MKKITLYFLLFFATFFSQNYRYYGTIVNGGIYGSGIIFEYDLDNNKVNKLFDFNNIDTGKSPSGTLFLANNKKFYGTTKTGGKYNYGVLYEFDVINKQFKKLYDFNIQTGGPYLNLIQADNNKLYGIAQYGGANKKGVIYEYDIFLNNFRIVADFNGTNGSTPKSSLLKMSNGVLYGATSFGGNNDVGTIYELDLKNNLIIKKYNNRNLEASHTKSDLIEANNGKIYGISNEGGSCSRGSLFEYDTNLNKMVLLNSFCFGSDGWFPDSGMIQAIDGNLYGVIGSLSGTLLYKYDMINKTYTPIKNFQDYGLYGVGKLLQAKNGNLYGLTLNGQIFEYNINSNTLSKKAELNDPSITVSDDSSLIEVDLETLSTKEDGRKIDLFFPNPTYNMLFISKKFKKLIIYSSDGKLIKEYSPIKNEIDVSYLSNGLFLVEAVDYNNKTYTFKFLKK